MRIFTLCVIGLLLGCRHIEERVLIMPSKEAAELVHAMQKVVEKVETEGALPQDPNVHLVNRGLEAVKAVTGPPAKQELLSEALIDSTAKRMSEAQTKQDKQLASNKSDTIELQTKIARLEAKSGRFFWLLWAGGVGVSALGLAAVAYTFGKHVAGMATLAWAGIHSAAAVGLIYKYNKEAIIVSCIILLIFLGLCFLALHLLRKKADFWQGTMKDEVCIIEAGKRSMPEAVKTVMGKALSAASTLKHKALVKTLKAELGLEKNHPVRHKRETR